MISTWVLGHTSLTLKLTVGKIQGFHELKEKKTHLFILTKL